MPSPLLILSGIDTLLQFIDRLSAASAIIKQARLEGRDVSSAELEKLKMEGNQVINDLDAAIARARAEGR